MDEQELLKVAMIKNLMNSVFQQVFQNFIEIEGILYKYIEETNDNELHDRFENLKIKTNTIKLNIDNMQTLDEYERISENMTEIFTDFENIRVSLELVENFK